MKQELNELAYSVEHRYNNRWSEANKIYASSIGPGKRILTRENIS